MTYDLKAYADNGKNLEFSWDSGLVISDISGLTSVVVNMATSQGVTQVGTSIQDESVNGKDLVIKGTLVGDSALSRKQLIDTFVPEVPVTLVYNNELELRVKPKVTPDVSRHESNAKFQVTVYAAYPYWSKMDKIIINVGGLEPMFSFPINYGETDLEDPKTHMFGRRIQSFFVNAENQGNVSAPFDLIFYAKTQVSNPSLTKVDTGEVIKINRNMVAGEKVSVYMTEDQPRVTSTIGGSEIDIFNDLDYYSTLFELDVGDNLVRYDATVNRDNLDCLLVPMAAFSGAYTYG
ncbi:phage tail family protein [Ruminococcaceae bacterium OttesenSCG-928-I18]|nr:phage tail family protein [Ruminococcaceae bacterium OttesenSCG-928-I18]